MNDRSGGISKVRIAGVCERDIDLLLLEEFQASAAFRTWLLKRCEIQGADHFRFRDAYRSVTHSSGESDLEVRFQDTNGHLLALLIENKIGASLQPLQAERYRVRGADYVSKSYCTFYRTVIVAPEVYFGQSAEHKGFDCRVTYESLLEWFRASNELGERRHHKAHMLESAIEKSVYGYRADTDDAVTEFFHRYWQLAIQFYPDLGMLKPTSRPSGSGSVYFKRPETVAIMADVAHKTGRGIVDLHLRGRGSRLSQVTATLSPLLEPGMSIEPAHKSAAIRLVVPKLDRGLPADVQTEAIRQCLNAAERLTAWAIRHAEAIAQV